MGKRTEYMRAWRAKNREKFNARLKAYRRAHPEYWKTYYQKNKDKLAGRGKKWYQENKESADKKYKEYYEKNKSYMRARASKWQKENPVSVNASSRKYQASKLNAAPKWANDFFIKEIYHLANLRSKMLGYKWHVDHIVPLRSKLVCGLHVENNLQVIPAIQNMRKHNTIWPQMP